MPDFAITSLPVNVVLETILDGMITIDEVGAIQSFNPAAERIFQYESAEVIGKNVNVLMPEPYHSEHDGYLAGYLKTGQRKVIGIGRKVKARRKDGTTFPMELAVTEMRVGDKRMFLGTIRDITDRILAEEEIDSYVKKLTMSNQQLDEFAYVASHDLKEPLMGLINNARFLEEDYRNSLDQAGKERLARMRYLCGRMATLIDDLFYYSVLGHQDMAIQQTDLNEVVDNIRLMMESVLQDKNASIRVPEPLPVIVCDAPRMTEVFRNLVSNAVKYNDKDIKTVEIGVYQEQSDVKAEPSPPPIFYVKDNGVGISPRFFSDIFKMFKRLDSEDEDGRGNGAGLTFVKKIIERHQGKIWVESELGVGSTFYFQLNAEADNTVS